MNYLLLTFSLLATQVSYGANASAQGDYAAEYDRKRATQNPEVVHAFDPKQQYGGLIAVQKFQAPGYEIDLLGEEHNAQTQESYQAQRTIIDRHIGQLQKTQDPHLFLVEEHPERIAEILSYRSSPISQVIRLLRKPSNIALNCFDRRPLGLAHIMNVIENAYRAIDPQVTLAQQSKIDWKPMIAALYESILAASNYREDAYLKEISGVEQELQAGLDDMVARAMLRDPGATHIKQDILQLAKFSSITDATSFIEINDRIMHTSAQEQNRFLSGLRRIARIFGDYWLTKAFHEGMRKYKRITVLVGEFHMQQIRNMLLRPDNPVKFSLTKSYSFAPTDGVPQALTGEQLREFFNLPATPVKQAEEVEGKQAAAQNVATATISGSAQAKQLICNACKKSLVKQSRCGKCKKVYYCDATCQKADWPKHKDLCGK